MPQIVQEKKVFSLLEVTESIKKTIDNRYTSSFWVKAEMNKLNLYKRSGHCYPELVEKRGEKVIAQSKAILWQDDYNRINKRFLEILKEPLKDGIKILFLARITFTSYHGLALQVLDIDPGFTLGDLEREKLETINKLKGLGIYDQNKKLQLPLLPQRIAIISVETSKGYADFLNVIENNPWKYKFFHFLFPSLLQGEKAVDGLIRQLKQIRRVQSHFDVVAIIRGGGGDIGLSCYNNYKMAEEIARFPLPVITGIGHATNETVAEMISFSNAITPTKLADYLIQHFHNFSIPVQKAEERIVDRSKRLLKDERVKFQSEARLFRSLTEKALQSESFKMSQLTYELNDRCSLLFKSGKLELNNIEKNVLNLSPQNVMKRGYSITRYKGRAVKNIEDLRHGDEVETFLYEGKIVSTVKSTKKSEEHE